MKKINQTTKNFLSSFVMLILSLVMFLKLYKDYAYLELLNAPINPIITTHTYKDVIINAFMSMNYEYVLLLVGLFIGVLIQLSYSVDNYFKARKEQ